MMGIKDIDERNVLKTTNLDNLILENYIIRKINKAIDYHLFMVKLNILQFLCY